MNYAQLFLHYFTYQKTRIFTDNKTLSMQLEEEANQLRVKLNTLSMHQHSLDELIDVVKESVANVHHHS